MVHEQFYIVDGHSLLYRSYHAPFGNLAAPDGTPTKAIYLFTKAIMKLCRTKRPAYLVIVFDSKSSAEYRKNTYHAYKGNRKPQEPDFAIQLRWVKRICRAWGICVIVAHGFEADDVIASLTVQKVSDDVHVTILSGDWDLQALVFDRRVRVYDPYKEEFINAHSFRRKNGFRACSVEDYLMMVGDSADNIPPLGGFGDKTAIKLLRVYKYLRCIVYDMENLPGKLEEKMKDAVDKGRVRRNCLLASLRRDLAVDVTDEQLEYNGLNRKAAKPLFKQLGFKRWS
jgi:DNA polymerase I